MIMMKIILYIMYRNNVETKIVAWLYIIILTSQPHNTTICQFSKLYIMQCLQCLVRVSVFLFIHHDTMPPGIITSTLTFPAYQSAEYLKFLTCGHVYHAINWSSFVDQKSRDYVPGGSLNLVQKIIIGIVFTSH